MNEENDVTTSEESFEEETVTLTREEYEKLNQTIGAFKKEIKTLKKSTDEVSQKQESNEPDYGRLAYLNSMKVDHPDDQKMVLDEANRLKLPISDVMQMEHMKSRLETSRNQRDAEMGTPSGSGRKGGAGKGDVDYYLAHPDEVPQSLELHNQVIDARIKRETDNSMFSQVPFIG